jgi:hypothetical protein
MSYFLVVERNGNGFLIGPVKDCRDAALRPHAVHLAFAKTVSDFCGNRMFLGHLSTPGLSSA